MFFTHLWTWKKVYDIIIILRSFIIYCLTEGQTAANNSLQFIYKHFTSRTFINLQNIFQRGFSKTGHIILKNEHLKENIFWGHDISWSLTCPAMFKNFLIFHICSPWKCFICVTLNILIYVLLHTNKTWNGETGYVTYLNWEWK